MSTATFLHFIIGLDSSGSPPAHTHQSDSEEREVGETLSCGGDAKMGGYITVVWLWRLWGINIPQSSEPQAGRGRSAKSKSGSLLRPRTESHAASEPSLCAAPFFPNLIGSCNDRRLCICILHRAPPGRAPPRRKHRL